MKQTIRELREARGESENQLAAAVGVPHTDVVAWEASTAQPTIERVRRLSAHFGVPAQDIEVDLNHAPSIGERIEDLF